MLIVLYKVPLVVPVQPALLPTPESTLHDVTDFGLIYLCHALRMKHFHS